MINCPVCCGTSYLVWQEGQYNAYRCEKCRIVFLHPFPQDPLKIYNDDYFNRWYVKYYPQRREYIEKLFSGIESYAGAGGKLLDVGCGTGILMEVAKERGWDVCGQDVSRFAVGYCRKKGFEVYDKSLPELSLPENSFDLITMFDVIAHLEDPLSYVNSCRRLLKPGGCLAIKTPCHPPALFLLANLLSFTGKSRVLLHVPAQLFHFPEKALKEISGGFEPETTVFFRVKELINTRIVDMKTLFVKLLEVFLSGKSLIMLVKKRDE